ncbi:ATP-binding protein [Methanosarcina sp. Kolksee]|uniref:ATP-binding protein n=1 Tax=Methanosarcina sp. Kolksee TaxID=1434099 RepID=UPI00350FB3D1
MSLISKHTFFKYLPFDKVGAHCLFQLISIRYEKSSTILTSNKSYGEWENVYEFFPNLEVFLQLL